MAGRQYGILTGVPPSQDCPTSSDFHRTGPCGPPGTVSGQITAIGFGCPDYNTPQGRTCAFQTWVIHAPPDTQAPSVPPSVSGAVKGTSLTLSWQASTDDVGVDHYDVYRNGAKIVTFAGDTTVATVSGFSRAGATAFSVKAVDAAGNASDASSPVNITPRPRPDSVPKAVPRWAYQLLLWQTSGSRGARPASAPKKLPPWYAAWKQWRLNPFQVASSK